MNAKAVLKCARSLMDSFADRPRMIHFCSIISMTKPYVGRPNISGVRAFMSWEENSTAIWQHTGLRPLP